MKSYIEKVPVIGFAHIRRALVYLLSLKKTQIVVSYVTSPILT